MQRPETSRNWTCRLILHAGDGTPDKEEQIYSPHFMDAAEAAEYFAQVLDDREAQSEGLSDSDFDNARSVIEVRTERGWKRFRVTCHVKRDYEAMGD